MLSIKHNFLFVHIPKTGGNSIQKVLAPFSEDRISVLYPFQDGKEQFSIQNPTYAYQKHSSLSEYKKLLPKEIYNSVFKFTVVRNPWERMLSLYFSPHAKRLKFDKKIFESVIQEAKTVESFVSTASWFNRFMGKNPIKTTEIQRFIKFEDLQNEFNVLCADLGLGPFSLAKLNASNHGNYLNYYDNYLKKLVENKFKHEIDFFEYQFESK